jgi:ribonuclease HIII
MALPRGVSAQVKNAAVALIQSKGPEALEIHAKMHFKTAAEALAAAAGSPTPA